MDRRHNDIFSYNFTREKIQGSVQALSPNLNQKPASAEEYTKDIPSIPSPSQLGFSSLPFGGFGFSESLEGFSEHSLDLLHTNHTNKFDSFNKENSVNPQNMVDYTEKLDDDLCPPPRKFHESFLKKYGSRVSKTTTPFSLHLNHTDNGSSSALNDEDVTLQLTSDSSNGSQRNKKEIHHEKLDRIASKVDSNQCDSNALCQSQQQSSEDLSNANDTIKQEFIQQVNHLLPSIESKEYDELPVFVQSQVPK